MMERTVLEDEAAVRDLAAAHFDPRTLMVEMDDAEFVPNNILDLLPEKTIGVDLTRCVLRKGLVVGDGKRGKKRCLRLVDTASPLVDCGKWVTDLSLDGNCTVGKVVVRESVEDFSATGRIDELRVFAGEAIRIVFSGAIVRRLVIIGDFEGKSRTVRFEEMEGRPLPLMVTESIRVSDPRLAERLRLACPGVPIFLNLA